MASNKLPTNQALAGLGVLVTRPAGLADQLINELLCHGADAVHLPMMQICPIESKQATDAANACVRRLPEYQHVIFISVNAVKYGFAYLNENRPGYCPEGQIFYGIGAASCAAIEKQGYEAVGPQTSIDSDGLLALPQLGDLSGQKVVVFRGVGGREYLAEQLTRRGAEVDYCEVYQRQAPVYQPAYVASLISQRNVRAAVVTSGEVLDNLLALLSRQEAAKITSGIAIVVPGERIAGLARQAGFEKVVVADNASARSLVAAISCWWQNIDEMIN
jgi:uroporphyrinogen-III synthase